MIFSFEVDFFDRLDFLLNSQRDISNLAPHRLTLGYFICYRLGCVSRKSLNGLLISI